MCGILGTFPSSAMNIGWLAHRGPDGQTYADGGDVAFAHARLSILDLTDRARQPIWSGCGRVLLTFNGEIYNFASLTADERGSDTVALVRWLAERGPDFNPAELDGMYAFGAWFTDEKTLVLCRDPVGIKPLYMALDSSGERLAFASEIKGFLGIEWFTPRPSKDVSLQRDTLQFGFIPPRTVALDYRGRPHLLELVPTLLEGVYQLCPGQKLTIDAEGRMKCDRTSLPHTQLPQSGVMGMLESSVREQSISDVQVGVQISGGVDSSLVAWQYAKLGHPVRGFYVSVPGRALNEDRWVEIASDAISRIAPFTLDRVTLTPAEFERVLSDVAWYMDEPLVRHPNAIGIYLLCEHVRKNTAVKVLLTGEGADEIFGGYGWHDGETDLDYEKTRRMFDLGGSASVRAKYAHLPGPVLRRQLAFDRWFYLPPILARQDRMSMAHGIEARVPFLSNAFCGLKAPQSAGKIELKHAAAQIFGEKFAFRPKCGFGLPSPWLGAHNPDWSALDWLGIKPSPKTPLQRWTLTSLALWSREYLHGGWRNRSQFPQLGASAKTMAA